MTRVLSVALLLISAGTFPLQAACPGGVSSSFTVSGEVTKRAVFDLNDLEQFPPAQQNVTYFAAGSVVTEAFTGVLLWDLLNNPPVNGSVTNTTIKNDILHKIVIVTGTDCYQSVFGAGEFDPFFGGSQIMVAYATGGQSLGSAGFARIVVPGNAINRKKGTKRTMFGSNAKQWMPGVVSAAVLMLSSFSAFAGDDEHPPHKTRNINLAVASDFYGVPPSNRAITDIISAFEADNPQYTVTVVDNGATATLEPLYTFNCAQGVLAFLKQHAWCRCNL